MVLGHTEPTADGAPQLPHHRQTGSSPHGTGDVLTTQTKSKFSKQTLKCGKAGTQQLEFQKAKQLDFIFL